MTDAGRGLFESSSKSKSLRCNEELAIRRWHEKCHHRRVATTACRRTRCCAAQTRSELCRLPSDRSERPATHRQAARFTTSHWTAAARTWRSPSRTRRPTVSRGPRIISRASCRRLRCVASCRPSASTRTLRPPPEPPQPSRLRSMAARQHSLQHRPRRPRSRRSSLVTRSRTRLSASAYAIDPRQLPSNSPAPRAKCYLSLSLDRNCAFGPRLFLFLLYP